VRVIFLEVEGVIMPPVVKMVARLLQKPIVAFKPSIDALNLILSETKAELVITDSGDKEYNQATQTKLREWGVRTTTFGRLPIIKGKGNGIIKWMSMAGEPESFVIIDCDEKRWGNMLRPYVIIADPESGGLTEALAKKAIGILKKGKRKNGRGINGRSNAQS
jgi:hypothetical protein